MMAAAAAAAAATEPALGNSFVVDEDYEFSAPRFYDFILGETDLDARYAELWFESARPYAPSPFMPKIKASRSVQTQIVCDFGEAENVQKAAESLVKDLTKSVCVEESAPKSLNQTIPQAEATSISTETTQEYKAHISPIEMLPNLNSEVEKLPDTNACSKDNKNLVPSHSSVSTSLATRSTQGPEVCFTPAAQAQKTAETKNKLTAKKIASILRNPSALNSKNRLPKSQVKSTKPASVIRDTHGKSIATPNIAQENRAIKRQKLEGGTSRQIHTVHNPFNLPHKTKAGVFRNSSNSGSFNNSTNKTTTCKEDRKIYVRELAAPFVSTAEMMRKFQTSTRDMSLQPRASSVLSQNDASQIIRTKPKLTLTRPKSPEFETSQRMRPVKIKSSAEIEEEMMAKLPKFKARPLNKKIFESPSLPPLPRTAPQPPEFREFHFQTMSRTNQNAETSSVISSAQSTESHQWKSQITAPRSPCLQTSLRARPPRIKSSAELEKEELENIPQFKARPLNKKIFESKGEIGLSHNLKKPVTIPQEFHFAIDKRIPPSTVVFDLFDKLSISSESFHQEKPLPRNTMPNPFHLHTDERGTEKERRMAEELMHKQLEEEMARVPKAKPYPYTTDYPVVPPKPEPKPCTKPEPFQLESLFRHEEEMQREMEERKRMEMEEAQMRIFKAQPVLKEDPIPVPEKPRMPLTEVQVFNLHVESRAVDRAEFDKKTKEKDMVYKRHREEAEAARMMEEEKALKQLRRTLVPQARPIPNFSNPFLPQRSEKGVTKAKSPKLRVKNSRRRRAVNLR